MNCGNCKKFIVEGALAITVLVLGMEINLCSEICHKELEKNTHPTEKNFTAEASRGMYSYVIMGSPDSTRSISATPTQVTFNENK